MKSDESNQQTEALLHQLPMLHLSGSRSREILHALQNEEKRVLNPTRRRIRRLTIWGGAALVLIAVGSLAVPYHGTESVLGGLAKAIRTQLNRPTSSQWLTEREKRQLAIAAIADLYGDRTAKVIRMKSTQTETQQPMYLVELQGHFEEGQGPQSSKIKATTLSFSMLADGSKAWALIAGDRGSKDKWSVNQTLNIQSQQLVYWGQTKDWTAEYKQARVYVWHTNSVDQFNDEGQAETFGGQLQYRGPQPNPGTPLRFKISAEAAGSSGDISVPPNGMVDIKMPNLNILLPSSPVKVTATMNGKTEQLILHALKNTS